MAYVIDKEGALNLVGNGAEYEFDVGAHAFSRTVYVARAKSGTVRLRAWKLEADGSFTAIGTERVVGSGGRTRITVFDNHRIVVAWLDETSALRVRGYTGTSNGGLLEGQDEGLNVESAITHFNLASVGVTTGVQQADPNTAVYYAYRHFALTTLSANGGWKLVLGTVQDSADVYLGPVALGGPGDKISLACARLNENLGGAHPRKAFTLCRDSGQIKTRSWRVAGAAVTSLATAAESKPLGVAAVHGMSIAPGNDIFASVVWPGASNATSRLQLISLTAGGAMTVYASAEITQNPVFAPLHPHGTKVAVAYDTSAGKLAVAAWRFAAPGSSGAARTVLAAKASAELFTQVRLTTLLPPDGDYPVALVTLGRAVSGKLRLLSWQLKSTLAARSRRPAGGASKRRAS